jgi:RimJ/RimL family protein N-acetyltransferase
MHHPNNTQTIETPRLTLICCTKELLEALFAGEESLAKSLGVNLAPEWTENGEPAFRWTYDKLTQPGAKPEWWSYLPVLKAENLLIGSGGYKGEPQQGMVEIGYEIAKAYRCKGLATEMAGALIRSAFAHTEVTKVQAHTLAVENESGSVLKKCGMKKVAEVDDPEDGKIWRWEIEKQAQ